MKKKKIKNKKSKVMIAVLLASVIAISMVAVVSCGSLSQTATETDITICQIKHNGDYDPDPGSLDNLVREINARTEYSAANGGFVTLGVSDLSLVTMLYITGHNPFSFADAERKALKTYLEKGGLLFADDCSNYLDDQGFETSFRNEMQKIFGEDLVDLPSDHGVFSSFYILDETLPTEWNNEPLQGIDIEGRTFVIYSDNDYGCGWEEYASPTTIENSYKMGINIAVYAYEIKEKIISISVGKENYIIGETVYMTLEINRSAEYPQVMQLELELKEPCDEPDMLFKSPAFVMPAVFQWNVTVPMRIDYSIWVSGGEYCFIATLRDPSTSDVIARDTA